MMLKGGWGRTKGKKRIKIANKGQVQCSQNVITRIKAAWDLGYMKRILIVRKATGDHNPLAAAAAPQHSLNFFGWFIFPPNSTN